MKILIAENEPEVLRLYKILLEEEGHEVLATNDGLECIEAYRNALDKALQRGEPAFDLVVVDHKMPKKTGVEVANEVLDMYPTQQLLMITAYGGELDLKDDLRKMKIMRKPFEVDELISLIHQLGSKDNQNACNE
ncbi:MAG: two-component system cell cycle response regulator CpdR [Candidatus Nitrosomirales archaeon]|jgi:two-component system cell cycle response regulator CpdR